MLLFMDFLLLSSWADAEFSSVFKVLSLVSRLLFRLVSARMSVFKF